MPAPAEFALKADHSQFVKIIELKDRSGRLIGSKEVVTYQGLLSKAHGEGLKSIRTALLQIPSDENSRTAIVKAEVETEQGSFEGIGDASPESVTAFLTPHLIRMAETRAKARALRDAVNIGLVSFEELDGEELPDAAKPAQSAPLGNPSRPTTRSIRNPVTTHGSETMTESQRRFIFRLLAGQGITKEAAHEHCLARFQVLSLSQVARSQASAFIDELQARSRGNGADAQLGAPVQR